MEGDRRITLTRPGDTMRTSSGDLIPDGEPISIQVFAVRRSRAGSDGALADTLIGLWQVRFEVRWQESTKNITPEWTLTDETGRTYDIESAIEAPHARRRWVWIYGVAREALQGG